MVRQFPPNRTPEPRTHPRGRFTIVWYRLSEFGLARFQVQRRVRGRWRPIGPTWTQPGGTATRSWYFSGRAGYRTLPPGTYRLAARAYDLYDGPRGGPAPLGPQVTRTFRLLAPRR